MSHNKYGVDTTPRRFKARNRPIGYIDGWKGPVKIASINTETVYFRADWAVGELAVEVERLMGMTMPREQVIVRDGAAELQMHFERELEGISRREDVSEAYRAWYLYDYRSSGDEFDRSEDLHAEYVEALEAYAGITFIMPGATG